MDDNFIHSASSILVLVIQVSSHWQTFSLVSLIHHIIGEYCSWKCSPFANEKCRSTGKFWNSFLNILHQNSCHTWNPVHQSGSCAPSYNFAEPDFHSLFNIWKNTKSCKIFRNSWYKVWSECLRLFSLFKIWPI